MVNLWSFLLVASWSLLWLGLLAHKCRVTPSRLGLVTLFVFQGAASCELAAVVYETLESLGSGFTPEALDRRPLQGLWTCVLQIGLVEEGAKWAAFIVMWGAVPRMRRSLDVVSGAAALGVGFAAAENLLGAHSLSDAEMVVRSFTSPFVHVVFGSIWAIGWSRLLNGEGGGIMAAWGSLAASVLLHGLYDFLSLDPHLLVVSGPTLIGAWLAVSTYIESQAKRRGFSRVRHSAHAPAPVECAHG